MAIVTGPPPDDSALIQQFLDGDVEVLGTLRQRHHTTLVHILLARGANATEAEDLLANLWNDCVPTGDEERPSLLEKYSGRCSLQSWLSTVATRKLIDYKRRERFKRDVSSTEHGESPHQFFENLPGATPAHGDDELVQLLGASIRAAFAQCAPDALLLLRLVYLEGVTQREVCRMFGWHETKVSRLLTSAMETIERETLRRVRAKDAWLNLTWEDFQGLCETHQIGFL